MTFKLRPGMTIILYMNVVVAGDVVDGGDVWIQGEQLAMVMSASIRGRHAARRFAGVGNKETEGDRQWSRFLCRLGSEANVASRKVRGKCSCLDRSLATGGDALQFGAGRAGYVAADG